MSLNELLEKKLELTKKGLVVEAAELLFAEDATTVDFDGYETTSREGMVKKMESFTSGIEKVNGITYHGSAVDGDTTFAEFTFDFDMKDGSQIRWHEIIRSVWNNGKIVSERYFTA